MSRLQNTKSRIKKCDAQSHIMWLTATFGAVKHHAKSFATLCLRLPDIFFLLKNSARYFFETRSICSIFFWGFAQRPHQKSNGPPLICQEGQLCLDKLDSTACEWSHVTISHLKQRLTRDSFVVCIAHIFKQIVTQFVKADYKAVDTSESQVWIEIGGARKRFWCDYLGCFYWCVCCKLKTSNANSRACAKIVLGTHGLEDFGFFINVAHLRNAEIVIIYDVIFSFISLYKQLNSCTCVFQVYQS